MSEIASRVAAIRQRIDAALARAGTPGRDVTIVAVTKYATAVAIDACAAAGLRDIGESRVLDALEKARAVREEVRWHLIGHLQRNKVRRALELFTTVHSVDSGRLAEALGAEGKPLDVLLQVNVSGEATKHGVRPEEARALWRTALDAGPLRVLGLMTMAPPADDPEDVRPVFRALRELRDALNGTGDGPPLSALSMGMSGDFEVAVEEGATHVRIGSALVGGIVPSGGLES